jgi:hypothetical protein
VPVHAEGPYGYRTVNVADQRHDPGSLYSWTAHAIRMCRECPELGWGEWRTLEVGDPRVLAIETRWREYRAVTLHDLSAEPAKVRLPDDADGPAEGERLRQVLGDADPPYSPGQEIALGRCGFRWLRQTDRQVSPHVSDPADAHSPVAISARHISQDLHSASPCVVRRLPPLAPGLPEISLASLMAGVRSASPSGGLVDDRKPVADAHGSQDRDISAELSSSCCACRAAARSVRERMSSF